MNVAIIGAGVAGLSASHFLREAGIETIIYECQNRAGGLSKSFQMAGEWFDLGGHASFAKDQQVREILENGVDYHAQKAVAYNYKSGKWIKNPVQINLAELDTDEKVAILMDYFNKPQDKNPQNYMQWLECQYGTYFAENYPKLYTEKYWTVEPDQLETKWVGVRMYKPSEKEVLFGAFEKDTEEVHYSGEIRYPKEGGFEGFIKKLEEESNIVLNANIKEIDLETKEIIFENSQTISYDYVINTAPLPEIVKLIKEPALEIVEASKRLHATSLILVSLCVEGKLNTDFAPAFYIYDSEIPATRVYSTTKYSDNYNGKTSLQAEVFISDFRKIDCSMEELRDKVVEQLASIGMFDLNRVIAKDVRFEKYANIIFTHEIYENREKIIKYLADNRFIGAGRFGEWDYYWTDQAILSGKRAAEKIIAVKDV